MTEQGRCSCPETQTFGGALYPVTLDPDCREHSYPRDEWRAGSPLLRHALMVDRATGKRLTRAAAYQRALAAQLERDQRLGHDWDECRGVDRGLLDAMYRLETPREVTRRLIAELAAPKTTGAPR